VQQEQGILPVSRVSNAPAVNANLQNFGSTNFRKIGKFENLFIPAVGLSIGAGVSAISTNQNEQT
jgi:hypothetical protein